MSISQLIDGILLRESREFTNYPSDRGGPTKHGITQATLSEWLGRPATIADVRKLTESDAREIYYHLYVFKPGFDRIGPFSARVFEEVVDTGVNCGQEIAARFLQRCLNVLNYKSKFYPDLLIDGQVGKATISALSTFLQKRGRQGEVVLLRALNCLQGARYIEIADRNESQEEYVFGWMLQRVRIEGE